MNKLEQKYHTLLKRVLKNHKHRSDRTGVGCLSVFGEHLEWDLSDNKFPILTGKAMFPNIFNTEFKWFINGETNIRRFKEAGINIWNEWADENGDLGPTYGHQLLNFNSEAIDQLKGVVDSLKTAPDSRRHIISLWNPAQLSQMALPPCYHNFQFFVDNENQLNMHVLQRSGDLFLGIPYDICVFSMLLLHVSMKAGYEASKIKLTIVDAHIYTNHIREVKDYLNQPINSSPEYTFNNNEIELKGYKKGKHIKAKVAI